MNDCTMSSSDSHDFESTVLPPPYVASSIPDHQNVTEDVIIPPPAPCADSPGGTSRFSPKSVPVTDVPLPHLPESPASTPVARNLNTGDPDIQVNSPHLVDMLPEHEMSPLNNPLTLTKLTTSYDAADVSSHMEDFNTYRDLSFPEQASSDQVMRTYQSNRSEKNFYNKNSEEVRGGGGGVKQELLGRPHQVQDDDDPEISKHILCEGPRYLEDTVDLKLLEGKNTALEGKNMALEEKNTALEEKIMDLEEKITDLNEELEQVKQENKEIKNEASVKKAQDQKAQEDKIKRCEKCGHFPMQRVKVPEDGNCLFRSVAAQHPNYCDSVVGHYILRRDLASWCVQTGYDITEEELDIIKTRGRPATKITIKALAAYLKAQFKIHGSGTILFDGPVKHTFHLFYDPVRNHLDPLFPKYV